MFKRFLSLILILFAAVLSACSWYPDIPISEPIVKLETFFDRQDSFYISQGPDGLSHLFNSRETEISLGSGASAMYTLYYYLETKDFPNRQYAETIETEENALDNAVIKRAKYMLYPIVKYWSDPYHALCSKGITGDGGPYLDEADIELKIYRVADKRLIGHYKLKSTGCPFTVLSLIPFGATTPESQLKKALDLWRSQPF